MPAQPISEKRLAANRANARKSTGPRSPEGKARSSRNHTQHGLYAAEIRLPEYWELRAAHLAAEAAEDYRADPPLAALVAHRVLLRVHNSYVISLLAVFYDEMFAAPDPRAYRMANTPRFLALIRYKGRVRRQTRALHRILIPAVLEFEQAQSARPKSRAASATPTPCPPSSPASQRNLATLAFRPESRVPELCVHSNPTVAHTPRASANPTHGTGPLPAVLTPERPVNPPASAEPNNGIATPAFRPGSRVSTFPSEIVLASSRPARRPRVKKQVGHD